MSAAHTPGPWIASPPSSTVGLGIVGPNGRVIADVSHCMFELESDEEDRANARLIAAAPMLFDACEDALEALKLLAVGMSHDKAALDMIRPHIDELETALTKASGGDNHGG